eukprot:Hpha_TRINITY_DN6901_c0_g2::TRINITY_DN6901_c0_g2_i1::g.139500::m.139500
MAAPGSQMPAGSFAGSVVAGATTLTVKETERGRKDWRKLAAFEGLIVLGWMMGYVPLIPTLVFAHCALECAPVLITAAVWIFSAKRRNAEAQPRCDTDEAVEADALSGALPGGLEVAWITSKAWLCAAASALGSAVGSLCSEDLPRAPRMRSVGRPGTYHSPVYPTDPPSSTTEPAPVLNPTPTFLPPAPRVDLPPQQPTTHCPTPRKVTSEWVAEARDQRIRRQGFAPVVVLRPPPTPPAAEAAEGESGRVWLQKVLQEVTNQWSAEMPPVWHPRTLMDEFECTQA